MSRILKSGGPAAVVMEMADEAAVETAMAASADARRLVVATLAVMPGQRQLLAGFVKPCRRRPPGRRRAAELGPSISKFVLE